MPPPQERGRSISQGAFLCFSTYASSSEQALRSIFIQARSSKPSIIFFDELNAIGRRRDGNHINRPPDIVLNVFLAEMDGFTTNEGVFVLAATNRPDVLDAAILRPGRFDWRDRSSGGSFVFLGGSTRDSFDASTTEQGPAPQVHRGS